jgi:hypothetical protein
MKTYLTNCVNSTAELIDEMVEQSEEITYAELLSNVTQEELDGVFPFYKDCPPTLTLESDYTTAFYKSIYEGKKCVYVEHSRIEYIFTN